MDVERLDEISGAPLMLKLPRSSMLLGRFNFPLLYSSAFHSTLGGSNLLSFCVKRETPETRTFITFFYCTFFQRSTSDEHRAYSSLVLIFNICLVYIMYRKWRFSVSLSRIHILLTATVFRLGRPAIRETLRTR